MNKIELHESILNSSQLTFARSGGNGGQNVNKVNTKVHLVLPLTAVGPDNQKVIAGILGGTYWGRLMNLTSHFIDEPKKSSTFFRNR